MDIVSVMNKQLINKSYYQFISPFSMIISGPSGSGKSVLMRGVLKNHEMLIIPRKSSVKVLWVCGQWQTLYNEKIPSVEIRYIDGLPSEDDISSYSPDFIIIDDMMNELADDKRLGNMFTKISHHKKINIVFITQNLFHQGKQMRNLHLNSHYLILMRNPRDISQIDILGRQLKISKALEQAYKDATKNPFGYLIIDFKQTTPKEYMLRTRILPDKSIKGYFSPIFYTIK